MENENYCIKTCVGLLLEREQNRNLADLRTNTSSKIPTRLCFWVNKLVILISERVPLFYLKVVLVPVKVQFQNGFRYCQEKCSKLDGGKLLKVIEKVMESRGISEGHKRVTPARHSRCVSIHRRRSTSRTGFHLLLKSVRLFAMRMKHICETPRHKRYLQDLPCYAPITALKLTFK